MVANSLHSARIKHEFQDCTGDRTTGRKRPLVTLLLGYCVPSANAAPAVVSPATEGGMVQVMLGLGLVLAVIAGAAWLLKRIGGMPRGPASVIKVIGASAVGQRERVVLLEVADTWLVIGVAPGQVRALHSMPKSENIVIREQPAGGTAKDAHFSAWLKRVMKKRNDSDVGG